MSVSTIWPGEDADEITSAEAADAFGANAANNDPVAKWRVAAKRRARMLKKHLERNGSKTPRIANRLIAFPEEVAKGQPLEVAEIPAESAQKSRSVESIRVFVSSRELAWGEIVALDEDPEAWIQEAKRRMKPTSEEHHCWGGGHSPDQDQPSSRATGGAKRSCPRCGQHTTSGHVQYNQRQFIERSQNWTTGRRWARARLW